MSILICLLLTKFGISSAFNICFLITSEYFPTNYSSTVFGYCGILSRIVTIMAPLIAEWNDPVPMVIYSIACLTSTLTTFFLKKGYD